MARQCWSRPIRAIPTEGNYRIRFLVSSFRGRADQTQAPVTLNQSPGAFVFAIQSSTCPHYAKGIGDLVFRLKTSRHCCHALIDNLVAEPGKNHRLGRLRYNDQAYFMDVTIVTSHVMFNIKFKYMMNSEVSAN